MGLVKEICLKVSHKKQKEKYFKKSKKHKKVFVILLFFSVFVIDYSWFYTKEKKYMKKIWKKFLCFLILPIALIAVGCTDSTSNNENSTQIENEVKSDNQEDLPIDIPDDSTEELPTEPETPAEPEEPSEPETPTEPETPAEPEEPTEPETPAEPEEPTDEPTEPEITQYSINYEVKVGFEEIIIEDSMDTPMDFTSDHPEFVIESNEGLLQYVYRNFGLTIYAIHFKHKEGDEIVTVERDGKQYLEFDFYHNSASDTYFSINGKVYIVEQIGGMVAKETFSIEISENSTFALDLDRM